MKRLVAASAASVALVISGACGDQVTQERGEGSASASRYWERVDLDARPVVKVVSGDTLIVDLDEGETTIKILGIRAPDLNSSDHRERCLGRLSSEHLKEMVGDAEVSVRYEDSQPRTDNEGNTRAHLAAQLATTGQSVGVEQVRSGWAIRRTDLKRYDDAMHSQMYMQADAEEEARQNQVGIWNPSTCR